jgi:glycerol uptake facilitator-like aquaporin
MTVARKLAAEALGTGLLVAAVVGSGIMADRLTDDTALALLANSITTGGALLVLIACLGPLSGAHFNPVVTLAFALRREIAPRIALGYVLTQALGGILGTLLAHAMFDLPILQVSTALRGGTGQWIAEAVASAGLILAILGALRAGANVALIVAAYILAAYWFTASTSFANPAVALARSMTDSFAGISPASLTGFWGAELAGGLLGLALAHWLFAKEKPPA